MTNRRNELVPKLRFKQFKEVWKKGAIGDYYENLRTGMTPSRTRPDYFKGNIPWISSGELNYGFIESTTESITQEAVDDTNLKIYPPNTLFIAITGLEAPGTRGKCAMNRVPAATNQSCMAFEVVPNVSTLFLFQWYKKNGVWLYYNFAQGTKQQSFNNKLVKNFTFNIPTLPEQQKIASFLSAVDEKIQQLTRKKELLEQYKKGVMQQLFSGKMRFKPDLTEASGDENGKAYPKWEEKRLGEVGRIITGSTPSTFNSNFYNGSNLFVSPADINNGRYVMETKTTLTDLGFKEGRQIKKGSVLFVCIGSTIGKVAQSGKDCITNQQINSIEANEGNSNDFIYSLLEYRAAKIKPLAGTQAVPQINKSDFSKLKFMFPYISEQQKIANYLSAIDTKIESVATQITQTQTFKKGLLQQMFV